MKLIDLNVRLDVQSDGSNNYWNRQPLIFNFIRQHTPDLVAFQEFLPDMLTDLKAHFDQTYHIYAVSRDERGESIPVMIKKEIFEIIDQNTLWLSKTPRVPSKLENSAFPRVMSYSVLKDKKSGKKLLFINTHLDYQFEDVIFEQAKLLHDEIDKLLMMHQSAMILTGDFNQYPNQKAISYLSSNYQNIFNITRQLTNTFHGFHKNVGGLPIDYVFISPEVKVTSFNIDQSTHGCLPLSDHYPLILEFEY
jgi:endonuclease/exonuclease/phosphatase family metal-dependent hydrolase